MIYLISFIIVLGLPVFLHELGHFLAAKSVGIRVEKFYVGFNFFNLGVSKKYKNTEYGIGLFPLGGYVKVAGILDENMDSNIKGESYEFKSKNTFQKVWFLSAGVIMNFILAIIIFSSVTFLDGYTKIIDKPIISKVYENIGIINDSNIVSPAKEIGLMKDDKIIRLNGISISSFTEIQEIIYENPNNEIEIIWERNNQEYKSKVIPHSTQDFSDGKIIDIGVVGISPYFENINVGMIESIKLGFIQTFNWISYMLSSLWALINGDVSIDQLSGPLGIAKIAGDTAQTGGMKSLIILMAIISINLGIINILPLPVVDGGHVVIAIIEGIYGKEIPIKLKYKIQVFGFLLLMFLFAFIFINDIKNIL